MIRNVVMGRLRTAAEGTVTEDDRAQLRIAIDGIRALDLPGQRAVAAGEDLGLRDGGWDFAITNDWADEASYRGYDADPEHNRHRAVIVALCEQVARVQFTLPG